MEIIERINIENKEILVSEMHEGNLHVLNLYKKLTQLSPQKAIEIFDILDDMNIRGNQIWYIFNDLCNQDILSFMIQIMNNGKTVELVNKHFARLGGQKAVISGAREKRNQDQGLLRFSTDDILNITGQEPSEAEINEYNQMLQYLRNIEDERELNENINTKQALAVLNNQGFTCGYEKEFKSIWGDIITYRLFYNDKNDIIYAGSTQNRFCYSDAHLYGIRQIPKTKTGFVDSGLYKEKDFNLHVNGSNIGKDNDWCFRIDLRFEPFKKYDNIVDDASSLVQQYDMDSFDILGLPIPTTKTGQMFKEYNQGLWESCVVDSLCNIYLFPETYKNFDEGLKRIYAPAYEHAEELFYKWLAFEVNSKNEKYIKYFCCYSQAMLGIELEYEKLANAIKELGPKSHKSAEQTQEVLEHLKKCLIEINRPSKDGGPSMMETAISECTEILQSYNQKEDKKK